MCVSLSHFLSYSITNLYTHTHTPTDAQIQTCMDTHTHIPGGSCVGLVVCLCLTQHSPLLLSASLSSQRRDRGGEWTKEEGRAKMSIVEGKGGNRRGGCVCVGGLYLPLSVWLYTFKVRHNFWEADAKQTSHDKCASRKADKNTANSEVSVCCVLVQYVQ